VSPPGWRDRLRSVQDAVTDRLPGRAPEAPAGDEPVVSRGDGDTVVSHVDDDPVAEPLPPLADDDGEEGDLSGLDDEEAPPVEIPEDVGLVELFRRLDPVPPLPLTAVHETGLTSLVGGLSEIVDIGLLRDRRVRAVLARLSDRLIVGVGPDGIGVRGVVRSRDTPWARIDQLTFVSRYQMLRGGLVNQLVEDASTYYPPVPGLKWVLRRVVGGVASLYERRKYADADVEDLRTELGLVLTDIERRGLDIELSGALRFVAFFSYGLSAALEREAKDRGIKIVRREV